MWHVWGRREVYTGYLWGDLTEGDHLEELGVDGKTIKMDLKRNGMERHGLD